MYLGLGNDFNSNKLIFDLTLLGPGRACMTKMPFPHFLPQFILSSKILTIPKAFVQRLLRLRPPFLRYRPLLRFRLPEPLSQRSPYMLRRRRRRKGSPEKPPRRRSPRRRRRNPIPGQRAGAHSVRVGARPRAGVRRRPSRRVLHGREPVPGAGTYGGGWKRSTVAVAVAGGLN